MKTQRLYRYLPVAALLSFWSCSSEYQTARSGAETDDLYGSSGDAPVYASTGNDAGSVVQRSSRSQRFNRQQYSRDANPDYSDDQQYGTNTDDYYTELSARKLNRGLSPDPGWNDTGVNGYNSGFVNGYNAATSAYSWNRWGFNNTGFYNGLGIGLGLGSFGYGGFGRPFYSPYYGSAFAYNGLYDSFYSPFGYGGYNSFYSPYAYNSFYSPFYSPFAFGGLGYGLGGYGGFYGNPYYYGNNAYVTGADPYRARTYNSRYDRSAGRYNDNFSNSPRAVNPNGGRSGYNGNSSSGASASNGSYYARPRSSGNGGYYYDNRSAGAGGRSGSFNNTPSTPAYNSNSNTSGGAYYARPRQSGGGGTYNGYSGGRSSYQQSQPSYQQPSYQSQSRGSYQQSQPSYQQPSYQSQSRGYSAPSYSAPSSGGGSYSGGGGGGSRGPR